MLKVETSIEINATPERVWSILTDFAAYSKWNPFIRSVEGTAEKNEQVMVTIQTANGKTMSFRTTVRTVTPNQELRWSGRFLFPGLFDGEHYLKIQSISADQVRFVQGEDFSGLLVPLSRTQLETRTKAGFNTMNQALKDRAESNDIV